MRKTVHMCLASHDEVLFRDEEDMIRGFNALAIAATSTETRILGESIMSDHTHSVVQTDDPKELSHITRYNYTRFFNSKYERTGRLGERKPFTLELIGLRHIVTALSYVLRQPVHHGITSTPFAYKHSSANYIFRKELGKDVIPEYLPDRNRYIHVARTSAGIMEQYKMDKDGLFLREEIIDTEYTEELYISPRNFLYQMNRLSGEEWEREQLEEDTNQQVINIERIESALKPKNIEYLLKNESGRIDHNWINDMELCKIIDTEYLPKHYPKARSIYSLTTKQREHLANLIYSDLQRANKRNHRGKYCSQEQLIRCLALKYNG